jgi:hypothetical protein
VFQKHTKNSQNYERTRTGKGKQSRVIAKYLSPVSFRKEKEQVE